MGVSFYKIKKWTKMIMGKSVHHVRQDEGKVYSRDSVRGYYNNLTEKVTRFGLEGDTIPKTFVDNGEEIYFTIAIFQYGLGAYDLYLINNDNNMLNKAIACANWTIKNQEENGGWKTFEYKNKEQPYSAMAQGEGISLLLRVYLETKDEKFLKSAMKAKDFLLSTIEDGGVSLCIDDDIFFYECTFEPLILNGWIFALWGLYDYCKVVDDGMAKEKLTITLNSLKRALPKFDIKYWSVYQEDGKRICSPFYHKLHIAQLRVMYDLFGDKIFKEYADKWDKYQKSFWKRTRAYIKKVCQKVCEK